MSDTFFNKIYCELIITSNDVSSNDISNELGIIPARQFNKGDIFQSIHSPRTGKRMNNLWAIDSKNIISSDENISLHVEYIMKLTNDKKTILSKYKADDNYEVGLWFWVETENAGIGLDFSDVELLFFNEIVNRVHISVITNMPTDSA